jgi:hypothetical protein
MTSQPAPPDHDAKKLLVKDARRRRVTMLDPYTLHALHRYDSIPAETLHQIAEEIGSGLQSRWYRRLWFSMAACVVLLAILATGCVIAMIRGGLFALLDRGLPPFLVTLFATLWLWLFARRQRFLRTRDVMLKYLRCPHCGYDIRGLPTDPADGATVCPECGCAWRLPVT